MNSDAHPEPSASPVLHEIAKEFRSHEQRGISALYPVIEVMDYGRVRVIYAFALQTYFIDRDLVARINEVATLQPLNKMMATQAAYEPTGWWLRNLDEEAVPTSSRYDASALQTLQNAFAHDGIMFAQCEVMSREQLNLLECSAVAWGVDDVDDPHRIWGRVIQNELLASF